MKTTLSNGKTFQVKKQGNRFYYWSPRCGRWFPVAKKDVDGI